MSDLAYSTAPWLVILAGLCLGILGENIACYVLYALAMGWSVRGITDALSGRLR